MKYQTFAEFYPFYLSEHSNQNNRRMHFVGNILALIFFLKFLFTLSIGSLIMALIVGYGFAWLGHAIFEKNKPATFQYPLYSFMADWVMFKDIITGKIKF